MGIGVLTPCWIKYFSFGYALVTENQAMTLLPNWTYSYVLQDKISTGASRQLVSCRPDYNANTAHLLTADNNSQREHFYKIAWQYVRDRLNLPILPQERSSLQEQVEKSSVCFPCDQFTDWWLGYTPGRHEFGSLSGVELSSTVCESALTSWLFWEESITSSSPRISKESNFHHCVL